MKRYLMPPVTVPRRVLLTGVAVAAVLVVPACGGSDHSSSSSGMNHAETAPSVAASAAGTFNDADVTFAESMIPHHQQAVRMAAMADGRASGAEVKELAGKIRAAQQPEIDTMTAWLAAWGRPAPVPSMDMDHGSMPGMMTGADMTMLADAKGTAFDRHFLTMMISHHEGAVEMARHEVAEGSNTEAKALAQKIITDQQAEITAMRAILERL